MSTTDKSLRKPSITRGQRKFAYAMQVKERRAYVFRLRTTGASYHRISQIMHQDPVWKDRLPRIYEDRQVYRDVLAEVQRRDAEMALDVNAVRQAELDLLDQLQLSIIGRALGTPANLQAGIPAQPPDLAAQQQVLRIMERRVRLLPGLAAPIPIAPVTPDGTEAYQGNGPSGTFFAELTVLMQQFGPDHAIPATDDEDPTQEEENDH